METPGFEKSRKNIVPISDISDFDLLIIWWNGPGKDYSTLCQYALDLTLAIPTTSIECERICGSVRKLVNPERNRLGNDIIEASECLKARGDDSGGMIVGPLLGNTRIQ